MRSGFELRGAVGRQPGTVAPGPGSRTNEVFVMEAASGARRYLGAFIAGFIAVPVFHQGILDLLYLIGFQPHAPFPTQPTAPFGVPVVWSLAFWGGVWGIILALIESRLPRTLLGFAIAATVFGAIFPSLAAWFVVFPLKGLPVAAGWKPAGLVTGLAINGAWGLGTALLLRGLCGKRA
jgi:hypothetical protein